MVEQSSNDTERSIVDTTTYAAAAATCNFNMTLIGWWCITGSVVSINCRHRDRPYYESDILRRGRALTAGREGHSVERIPLTKDSATTNTVISGSFPVQDLLISSSSLFIYSSKPNISWKTVNVNNIEQDSKAQQAVRKAAIICFRPCRLTFDLLTLKVLSESCVTWATSVPILVFLGQLSVLDLGPMSATDRCQTSDAHRRLMPPDLIIRNTHSCPGVC